MTKIRRKLEIYQKALWALPADYRAYAYWPSNPPKWFYRQTFEMLCEIGIYDSKMPRKVRAAIDEAANYCGDVVTGRIKQGRNSPKKEN